MMVVLLTTLLMSSAVMANVLFSDDFEDGNADDWLPLRGDWAVVDDGSGNFVYEMLQPDPPQEQRTMAGDLSWADYAVEARVKITNPNGTNRAYVCGRLQDFNNYYAASLYMNSSGGKLELRKKYQSSTQPNLADKAYPLSTDVWYTVKLEFIGSTINMYVNGVLELTATDADMPSGAIGLDAYRTSVQYDDVVVTEIIPVLFSDDFEDGNADDWTPLRGDWTVVDDGGGNFVYEMLQPDPPQEQRTMAGDLSWVNYSVEARVKITNPNGTNRAYVCGRLQDFNNYYAASLYMNSSGGKLELRKKYQSSTQPNLADKAYPLSTDVWYTVKLEFIGSTINMYVDGVLELTAEDTDLVTGAIGLDAYRTSVQYDDVVVMKLKGPEPIPDPEPTPDPDNTPFETTPAMNNAPGLIGFAIMGNGTVGGEGGEIVTVNTKQEFQDAVSGTTPRIVQVHGTIELDEGAWTDVGSNKTIIGLGADAKLRYGGLRLKNATNVIIKNLTLFDAYDPNPVYDLLDGWNSEYDNMNIEASTNVWVDHCTFDNGYRDSHFYDGMLDIKNGSDYITVSYNEFWNHSKTSLLGSTDSHLYDVGKLNVTYHHNFYNGTGSRHPRVRFGHAHVFNNYYLGNAVYGIGIGDHARIYSEENYFENVPNPSAHYDDEESVGYLEDVNSYFVNSGEMLENVPVPPVKWEPANHYSYSPDLANLVKQIVLCYAGAGKPERIGDEIPPEPGDPGGPSVVPEPSTVILLGLGVLGILTLLGRKKR